MHNDIGGYIGQQHASYDEGIHHNDEHLLEDSRAVDDSWNRNGSQHSSSSEWSDPLPPPRQGVEGGSMTGDPCYSPTSPQAMSFAASMEEDGKEWAQVSDSEDEECEERDSDEEDTTAVLARANVVMKSASTISREARRAGLDSTTSDLDRMDCAGDMRAQVQQAYLRRQAEAQAERRPQHDLDASSDSNDVAERVSYLPGMLQQRREKMTTVAVSKKKQAPRQSSRDQQVTPLDLLKDLQEGEGELCKHQEQVQAVLEKKERQEHLRSRMQDKGRSETDKPRVVKKQPRYEGPSPCDLIVPRISPAYKQLTRDPGFCHAQRAGILWQSLVSQHVRFPSKWWKDSRHPPMGVTTPGIWHHLGRHRVRGNQFLERMVRHRGSAGRLLLHVMLRDIMSGEIILDLAVGCFHPNARGVRETSNFDPVLEGCRDMWLALRQRNNDVSVIESLLTHNRAPDESPLGEKHEVNNENMRAVFGETPPAYTIMVFESELYELFASRLDGTIPPAAVLLEEYHPDW